MTIDLTIQEFEVEKARRIEELKKDCFAILDKGRERLDEDFKKANEKLDAEYQAAIEATYSRPVRWWHYLVSFWNGR